MFGSTCRIGVGSVKMDFLQENACNMFANSEDDLTGTSGRLFICSTRSLQLQYHMLQFRL